MPFARSSSLVPAAKVSAQARFIAVRVWLACAGSAPAATHCVDLNSLNPTPPYISWATAATNIQDAVDAAVAGDEVVVTNGIYATGGRPVGTNLLANRVAIDKPLTLRSVNGPQVTFIRGHQVPGSIYGDSAVRCVYMIGGASLCGFALTNGGTRFPDSAGFEAASGGGVWCASASAVVSNCVLAGNSAYDYGGGAYGGTLINCTLVGNYGNCGSAYASTLAACALIGNTAGYGGGAESSTLTDCTLTGNSASTGGGADSSTLTNCILTDNLAVGDGGGGAAFCTLMNCALSGNSSSRGGGGAYAGTLCNCTLTGNSAAAGGGAAGADVFGESFPCSLNNCLVYFNAAGTGPNYDTDILYDGRPSVILSYCCSTPMPTNGVGNITGAPLFVDLAGGNLRLQANSPCINAGNNDYVTTTTDLDGNPRILGGTVDIGAYEFVSPELLIEYLIGLVNESSLPAKRPLLAALDAALASLQRGNDVSAINQLRAFQHEVRAQVEPLNAPLASALIQRAQESIDGLSG